MTFGVERIKLFCCWRKSKYHASGVNVILVKDTQHVLNSQIFCEVRPYFIEDQFSAEKHEIILAILFYKIVYVSLYDQTWILVVFH